MNRLSPGRESASPSTSEPSSGTVPPETEIPPQPQMEAGGEADGEPVIGKLAARERPLRERVTEKAYQARPYVVSGIKAGVPAALFGKIMVGEGAKGSHAARIAGLTGAGLGIANEAMQRWAEQNRRRALARKILSTEED